MVLEIEKMKKFSFFFILLIYHFQCTGADELAGIKWNLSFMPKRIDGNIEANTLKEYGSIQVELNGNCTNCSNLNSISNPENLELVLTNEKQDIASLSYQVTLNAGAVDHVLRYTIFTISLSPDLFIVHIFQIL